MMNRFFFEDSPRQKHKDVDQDDYEMGGSNYANNNSPMSLDGGSVGGRDNDQKPNPFHIERQQTASSLAT